MNKKSIKIARDDYIDRDVSWMYFNYRILKEAEKDIPLYEKLSFLGIYSNNLDEFYKVRVAAFKRIATSDATFISEEKKQAKKDLKKIIQATETYSQEFEKVKNEVFKSLEKQGIYLVDEKHLSSSQEKFIHKYFIENIAGYISPIILSKKANLLHVNDSHIYLACKISKVLKDNIYALIPLPVHLLGRFISLGEEDNKNYVMYLDDIVRYHLPYIFKEYNYDTFEAYAFKFAKDADIEVESDPEEGLLKSISQAVKNRKSGVPVRVVLGEGIPDDLKKILLKRLNVGKEALVSIGGKYHNNRDLMHFPVFNSALSYEKWEHYQLKEVVDGSSLIDKVQNKDFMIHVPYESFDAFIKILQEAAISKKVSEIKASLYRTSKDSKVVSALANASLNGKKVTAVVELMARFDEDSNIVVSQKLLDAGCDVLTGEEGFKIHGKLVYIKMKEGKDIAIISTGNFHEGNAKHYTDCLLFTSDLRITQEVNLLFNFIKQPFKHVNFKHLLVSPDSMQQTFKKLIRNEIRHAENNEYASIKIKINHITDKEMVKLLYNACDKGVKVDLLVRGNCSLVAKNHPNMTVHAIIDRYLEHSRIFIFENGGSPLYFMGSADWMPRNLYNRIEVVTPVYDEDCKKELDVIVNYGLLDNVKACDVRGDGEYTSIEHEKPFRSQEELQLYYKNKHEEVQR